MYITQHHFIYNQGLKLLDKTSFFSSIHPYLELRFWSIARWNHSLKPFPSPPLYFNVVLERGVLASTVWINIENGGAVKITDKYISEWFNTFGSDCRSRLCSLLSLLLFTSIRKLSIISLERNFTKCVIYQHFDSNILYNSNTAQVEKAIQEVPKCDVIKFSFFAFQQIHDKISVEHDEKRPHTKFYMNRFMGAQDMAS